MKSHSSAVCPPDAPPDPKKQAAVPVFRHSRFSYALGYSSVLSPGRQAFALAIMPQETWQ